MSEWKLWRCEKRLARVSATTIDLYCLRFSISRDDPKKKGLNSAPQGTAICYVLRIKVKNAPNFSNSLC